MLTKKAIALWVERMYKAGVIERAPYWNEFQSACFVVPKKDGKDRMVVDMWKVNGHILEEDFAPAIPITHLMAEIQSAGSQLFSSIDIQHAFFSLHIMAGTEDATVFYADTGTNLTSWGEICLENGYLKDVSWAHSQVQQYYTKQCLLLCKEYLMLLYIATTYLCTR